MVVSGWPPVKGPSEDVEGLEGLGGDLQAGDWRPRLDLDPKPALQQFTKTFTIGTIGKVYQDLRNEPKLTLRRTLMGFFCESGRCETRHREPH